jgi:lipopolysaccharide/colanic/teichoic acid biosynthesis glycosyltransferase
MSWLLLLITSATVNFLVLELFDWLPWLARRLVRRAVRKLPSDVKDRYLDEWLAELDALPGRGVSKFLWAIQILIGASRVSDEILGHSRGKLGGVAFAVKRTIDCVSSATMVALLAPAMLCSALAVRLSSSGPVFSREQRIGRQGKVFGLYRFRSADAGSNNDRYTPVGRFLRQTSLDELPQLLNVVRGEMSLIGPRPKLAEFDKQKVVSDDSRYQVKPGITGWAQVHNVRGRTSLAERLELDNYYIANWSLGLDLKIFVLTFLILFRKAE